MSKRLKRELIWFGAAVLSGVVLMPLAVYATGALTLGPYSRGSAGRFLGDFLRSLVRLEWQALTLALAPIALILAWRVVRAIRDPHVGDAYEDATPARECRAPRADPLARWVPSAVGAGSQFRSYSQLRRTQGSFAE